ncbi:MAG: glycosyltransferase family 2 protein [Lachnospiraceae bacterium]|nr:glycosyltransferase family 2 protein [Lachnospiraceae bacterium]
MKNRNSDACKVSVIVPVYRVEKYIDRCMKSLLKQTLKDIEILCICEEEDSSFKTLCDYERSDQRVRVIKKTNTGVSSARNAGMKAARGEYIAFVDADDWIERYALQTLYRVAKSNDAQIIAYGIWPTIEPKGDKRGMFQYSPDRNVVYHGNGMMALFYEHGSKPYIGNKFYSRKFLAEHNILFHEDIDIGEDQLLQFEAFGQTETICFVKDKLYHYDIKRNNSAMNTCEQQQIIEDKNFKLLQRIMEHKSEKYANCYNKEYILWILQYYGEIVNRSVENIAENRRNEILAIQGYLKEMSAEKYISDLPKEYQYICERFLNYPASKTDYERIHLPYKLFEIYLTEQSEGFYEKMTAASGVFEKVKRVHEAIVFHEFRHLATKALVKFGVF